MKLDDLFSLATPRQSPKSLHRLQLLLSAPAAIFILLFIFYCCMNGEQNYRPDLGILLERQAKSQSQVDDSPESPEDGAGQVDVQVSGSENKVAETPEGLPDPFRLAQVRTSCSCFENKDSIPGSIWLCQCHVLCWNGSTLIAQGDPSQPDLPCTEEPADVATSGPLRPSSCTTRHLNRQLVQAAAIEVGLPRIQTEPQSYIAARNPIWRLGRSYLQPLTLGAERIPDFVSKVLFLLLINKATVPAFLPKVDRAVLPRDQYFRALMQRKTNEGLHASLLQNLLRMAFSRSSQQGPSLAWDSLDTHLDVVEFETTWDNATDSSPLCFEDVVIPGLLQGTLFPGGRTEAEIFHGRLRNALGLPQPLPPGKGLFNGGGTVPRLLFIRRTDTTVRFMDQGSRSKLLPVLKGAGFEVAEIELANVAFREAALAVRNADVVLGLHGAGLATAIALAGANTVIVEIMPFHAFSAKYLSLAVNTGLVYFQYQAFSGPTWPSSDDLSAKRMAAADIAAAARAAGASEKGATVFSEVAARDLDFLNMTVKACTEADQPVGPLLACRRHFLRDRPVILWQEDMARLPDFFKVVRDVVGEGVLLAGGAPEAAGERVHGSKAMCVATAVGADFSRQDFFVHPHGGGSGQSSEAPTNGDVCVLQRDKWAHS